MVEVSEQGLGTRLPNDATRMRVSSRDDSIHDVSVLTLEALDDEPLPRWHPGAHVEVHLDGELVRHYSLCGDPGDRHSYTIAVLHEPEGRGGSAHIHETAHPGTELIVGKPLNTFALEGSDRYLFIAGGIGITPLLPMLRFAAESGAECSVAYVGRSRASMAFLADIESHSGTVSLYPRDETGRPDLETLLDVDAETLVYACGPAGLLDAIDAVMRSNGRYDALHTERFRAPEHDDGAESTSFTVTCEISGIDVEIAPDISILEALRGAGLEMPSSCEEGVCGSCETFVLAGTPDHRDFVLSDTDRARNDCMMVCVSRSKSPTLTLDV